MKTCPKKCGMYSDVETRCPVCGARLYRVNSSSGQATGNVSVNNNSHPNNNITKNGAQMSYGFQNNTNVKVVQTSNTNAVTTSNVGSSTNSNNGAGFHYNIQKFTPQANAGASVNSNYISKQNNPAVVSQNTMPVIKKSSGDIRGRVINKMEIHRPQSKFMAIANGLLQGGISFSDTVTNFDVIELDGNNKQTGNDRTVCFRGDITYGIFNDGDIVQVQGKLDRGGCIFAKKIYNESKHCEVKVSGQISLLVPLIIIALVIFLVVLVASNIEIIEESITTLIMIIAIIAVGKRYIRRGGRGFF